ncbi:MAG TPA: 1-phosphofructokinase [Chloroflexia bacterium]|nr:1-phosphofructokinase [Chloroflexia bacterium]
MTVTINPVIDQTIAIPNFTPGQVNRVKYSQFDAGGKGINVASCLCDFGYATSATGFLGAENNEIFWRFLARKGIEDRFVTIPGHTRIGIKVIDEVKRQTTDINFPGQTPEPAHIEQLFQIVHALSATSEWFVLSGSIPPGVAPGIYRELIKTLAGKKVVLDTIGEGFRQALTASPSIIKPNVHELQEFSGRPLETPAAILEMARAIIGEYGVTTVVVSMGKDGAIFVEGDEAIWAVPPDVEVKSTVGAGDAMVAGIVAAKLQGFALSECARLATAFSMDALRHIGSGLSSVPAVRAAEQSVILRACQTP